MIKRFCYPLLGILLVLPPLQVIATNNSLTTISPLKHLSKQKKCLHELQGNQVERKGVKPLSEEEWNVLMNDLIRRKRAGEILGEGCLHCIQEYIAESLICNMEKSLVFITKPLFGQTLIW